MFSYNLRKNELNNQVSLIKDFSKNINLSPTISNNIVNSFTNIISKNEKNIKQELKNINIHKNVSYNKNLNLDNMYEVKSIDIISTSFVINIANSLSKIINDCGITCVVHQNITNDIIDKCDNDPNHYLFIFCPHKFLQDRFSHNYPSNLKSLPKDKYFLYQLEKLDSNIPDVWNNHIIKLILNSKYSFDYSENNMKYYENGANKEFKFKVSQMIPPVVEFKDEYFVEWEDKIIDVLFCGALTKRRQEIIDELTKNGINVTICTDVFGEELTKKIAQSKIFLNISTEYDSSFEYCRIHEALMSKNTHIISEKPDNFDEFINKNSNSEYKDRIIFVDKLKNIDSINSINIINTINIHLKLFKFFYYNSNNSNSIIKNKINVGRYDSKKILLISHDQSNTGAPIYLINLKKFLDKYNISNQLIYMNSIKNLKGFYNYVMNNKDIILICNTICTYNIVKIFVNTNIKILWFIHEWIDDIFNKNTYPYIFNDPDIFNKNNINIIFCNNKILKQYKLYFPYINLKNVTIINYAYNIYDLNKKKSNNIDFIKKDIIISIIGTIDSRKNQQSFIDNVFYKCCDKFNNIKLLLVGKKTIPLLIKEKYKNYIIEIGEVNNAIPYINLSDIIVSYSINEVLPLNILESMFCSKPVISSNVGCISDVINNNINGFLFNLNDHSTCYNLLEKLILDESLRNKIGINANISFLKLFNEDITYQPLIIKILK